MVEMPAAEPDLRPYIRTVVEGGELSADEAAAAMHLIMTGGATGSQIGALVTSLRMRGETIDEIVGFARTMRQHALSVELSPDGPPVVDTCGTGGDAADTFNISTTAAFVIAGAGVRVAKHGNRAVTSRCGSADVLEGLGIAIELSPTAVARCIEEVGIGFMYAPAFHPAMRFVGPARREIGIRTVFNILGPLTNPAGAEHQLIGVGHPDIAHKLAHALQRLGSQHAVLVHAEEGLDELGLGGPSAVTELDARTGEIRTFQVAPEDFGLNRASIADLKGGSVADNVSIARRVLEGEPGPRRSITLLNAGAGIFAANAAGSFAEGITIAAQSIDSGKALTAVDHLAALSQQLAQQPAA